MLRRYCFRCIFPIDAVTATAQKQAQLLQSGRLQGACSSQPVIKNGRKSDTVLLRIMSGNLKHKWRNGTKIENVVIIIGTSAPFCIAYTRRLTVTMASMAPSSVHFAGHILRRAKIRCTQATQATRAARRAHHQASSPQQPRVAAGVHLFRLRCLPSNFVIPFIL